MTNNTIDLSTLPQKTVASLRQRPNTGLRFSFGEQSIRPSEVNDEDADYPFSDDQNENKKVVKQQDTGAPKTTAQDGTSKAK